MLYLGKSENLKNLTLRINNNINNYLTEYKTLIFRLENSYVLTNPEVLYKYKRQEFDNLISKLEVLNPLNTLKRGYSITRINNKVVSDISIIKSNDMLEIELLNGKVDAKVVKVGDK